MVIELAAARMIWAPREHPERCWADTPKLGYRGACGATPVDRLGLCAFHRERLFGDAP